MNPFTLQYKMTRVCICTAGSTLSQFSDSGQTLSEDSGVDIAESGRLSKESSPRPARTRPVRESAGGGEGSAVKPVRPRETERTRKLKFSGGDGESKSENRWMCEQSYYVKIVCLSRVEISCFDIMLYICFSFTSF